MKECFTKEAIANFLGMTEEEVSDSIRRGVNIYKKNFDKLIDGNTDSANTPEANYTISSAKITPNQETSTQKIKTFSNN
ncbi:MAG: hypothetical protein MSS28_04570 [Tenericutes bacterium]|nr:hypothetical protein [Mycoplasmatota bacterium]